MKHEMTLYLADKKINALMQSLDLSNKRKQFVMHQIDVTFNTTSKVNKAYFLNIIKKSKEEKDYWIPAIKYKGVLYHDDELCELSNGEKSLILQSYK